MRNTVINMYITTKIKNKQWITNYGMNIQINTQYNTIQRLVFTKHQEKLTIVQTVLSKYNSCK